MLSKILKPETVFIYLALLTVALMLSRVSEMLIFGKIDNEVFKKSF